MWFGACAEGRRNPGRSYRNILSANNLYATATRSFTFSEGATDAEQRNVVDQVWTGYESHLPRAIAQLTHRGRPLAADVWLRTLVPFVTGLFVRTPDYFNDLDGQHTTAFGDTSDVTSEPYEHANTSRLMVMQRLLAPVCAARWIVLHAPASERHITNDRGLARALDSHTELPYGWTIPLNPTAALAVMPRMRGPVMYATIDGSFSAVIEHHDQLEGETWGN